MIVGKVERLIKMVLMSFILFSTEFESSVLYEELTRQLSLFLFSEREGNLNSEGARLNYFVCDQPGVQLVPLRRFHEDTRRWGLNCKPCDHPVIHFLSLNHLNTFHKRARTHKRFDYFKF